MPGKMKWINKEANPRLQNVLSSELEVTPYFSQILINRGIKDTEEARAFLFGDISSCHDPYLLKDMDRAVQRIEQAVSSGEKILVYGDYDVDGITSTALLSGKLTELNARHQTFIPHRMDDGYGLNGEAVKMAGDSGVGLLVTVDCGINSVEEVEIANNKGIDVIITDHHEVRKKALPNAYAVVSPRREDCRYPFKDLAGVGIAYKLAMALSDNDLLPGKYLDLVALGTIADVAPLNGENRLLAKAGLERLRVTESPGIKALIDIAGLEQRGLTCRNIAFALAPRINAMGRVGSADMALELFITDDRRRAVEIAATLDRENRNRQCLEREILKSALEKARRDVDLASEKIIVLADDSWHPGVIGIVASRIAEEFTRPAILISLDGENGKGSGRAAGGFDLFKAVNGANEHLVGFGGHEAACGIKIKRNSVEGFRKKLNSIADEYFLGNKELSPELSIDVEMPLSQLGMKLIRELNLLMPHGPGNAEPVLAVRGLKVKTRPREIGKSGVKFLVTDGRVSAEAITFRKNFFYRPLPGETIDLAYTPSINSYNGVDSLQLNIRDIRPSE
ncbi:MAG: single-stranded-DNA-specific exonuclease RecJ [Candidatus Omnitrophota bacterium]